MSVLNFSFFLKDRSLIRLTLFYFGLPLALLFLGRNFFLFLSSRISSAISIQNTWALLYGFRFDFSVVFLVYGFLKILMPSPSTAKSLNIYNRLYLF